ncbi:MAG: 3-hydroxyacyl-CoA dehydrogenase family protein [Thermoplasmatota archaeon]|nr:3-hydroxyacyl-CoA dehydrogenase family protein [Halobacteriales archaeon]
MDVKTVAVLGAGTMGAGIAQVCAQAGLETRLFDAQPEALERGSARITDFWSKGISKGKTTVEQRALWMSRLHLRSDLGPAVRDVDLVIEAVPEEMKLKQKVFADVDQLAPPHALLASNTSSLSVHDIAKATKRPHRVLGMHFFNPVPLMPLLEIVRHAGTSPEAVQEAQDVGAVLGKTSVVVRDSPGFATSRLGIVLGNEAMRMLEEGVASARDIDTAMRLGYGHPMGPLELSDLVGLDVRLGISDYLNQKLGLDRYAAPPLVRKLVARGELGKKTGKGIYDWSDGTPRERRLP